MSWTIVVPTKLERIMPGWVNAADRGIVGDGSTNCSTRLQSLINELNSSGGGTIYFPPGVYKFGQAVQIYRGISLVGVAPTRVKFDSVSGRVLFTISGTGANGTHTVISGIQFVKVAVTTDDRAADICIDRCVFGGAATASYLALYPLWNVTYGQHGVRISNSLFVNMGFDVRPLLVIQTDKVPVSIVNCKFETDPLNSPMSLIEYTGSTLSMEAVRWESREGNAELLKVLGGRVVISDVTYRVTYHTKTLVNIQDSNSRVVIGDISGEASNCTFNIATGYTDRVVRLSDMRALARTDLGASLWLPTDRSTTSDTFVTLKSFRTTLSGEVRVRFTFNTEPENGSGSYRVLRNGDVAFQVLGYVGAGAGEGTVQVSPGDLIEIQAKVDNATRVTITDVTVKYIPYFIGDWYDIND